MAKPIMLVLTYSPEEGTRLRGPLKDKMLCYAMLQQGMDIVREFHAQAQATQDESRIIPASLVPFPPGKM